MAVSKKSNQTAKSELKGQAGAKSRVRRLSYKDKKKSVKVNEPIPSSFKILGASIRQVLNNKKLFFGIMAIYSLLYLLLVKGFAANFQLPNTKQAIEEAGVEADTLILGVTLLSSMFGNIGSTPSESAAIYQVFLFIFISLVLIWALRHSYSSSNRIKVRQAFYSSMSPLVQYILVWFFICIQLIPALIGLTAYGIVSSNGIAVGLLENILWLSLMVALVGWSLYMVSSSLFATYIVSLPDMAPLTALRKARKVVQFRRFAIIRKAIFMPIFIIALSLLIFFPLVIYLTVLAEAIFMIFIVSLLLFGHAYFYNLYKSLI